MSPRTLISFGFVLLWSTGFVGARWGLPYAGPYSLLALRLICAAALLGAIAWMVRAPWPRTPRAVIPIVGSGLLTHGAYLGGVFTAIAAGAPTGAVALIVGLQPLLTTICGPLAGQPRATGRQWLGIVLGMIGLALVLPSAGGTAFPASALAFAVIGLLGITAGSLIQKRWVPSADFRAVATLQYGATAVVFLTLAIGVEGWRIDWSWQFAGSLIWLTGALSVGAIALLYRLLRERSMEEVASLFYATPAVTAVMGLVLFDERLGLTQWLGFPFVALAVWLSARRR